MIFQLFIFLRFGRNLFLSENLSYLISDKKEKKKNNQMNINNEHKKFAEWFRELFGSQWQK